MKWTFAYKLDNMDEMNKFLESPTLGTVRYKETGKLGLITKEIE